MPTMKCYAESCENETTRECQICNRPFCINHASKEEPDDFCIECLNSVTAEMKEKPLVDDEGVKHEGRELTPIGQFWVSSCGAIANMKDEELERFYNQYQLKVRELEALTDHYRVMKSMVSMEQAERQRSKSRSKRGVVITTPSGQKVQVKAKNGKTAVAPVDIAKTLADSGMDLTQLANLIQAAMAAKAAKK